MSAPHLPSGLAEIASRYDVLLCDIWGVIHNGHRSFPAACEALVRFRRDVGPVILISNSPRPAPGVRSQLAHLGVPEEAWTAIITSGDATRVLLGERAPGPAWIIGPDRDAPLYEGLGLQVAKGPEDAAFIACTGPVDDDVETPEDYRAVLAVAAERGLTMICANPDKVVQKGDRLIYCGGALADLYETQGGKVLMAGKPWAPIYDLAFEAAQLAIGGDVDRGRVLCIGDGVHTDVAGAKAQALDCLFIAAGIHGGDLVSGGQLDADRTAAFLSGEATSAAWAMTDLVW
jgi:HAD superfamily hydrolase (TIGR01459 family)